MEYRLPGVSICYAHCDVCQDLAAIDDVAELVRSVGPTVIYTPLLDGPQLSSRRSARYASVLAEDRGTRRSADGRDPVNKGTEYFDVALHQIRVGAARSPLSDSQPKPL